MRLVIIEDEPLVAKDLQNRINKIEPEAIVTATIVSVSQAKKWFAENPVPDLILSDIQLSDGISFDIFESMHIQCPVIFTTAYDVYAIQAFELHVVDYLLKPIKAARLQEALSRVRQSVKLEPEILHEMQQAPRACLSAAERGRVHLIPVEDVLFLRAELKYVTVRTASREYLIEESLTQLEQEFGDRFVRVHRNCLVARAAIRGFERVGTEDGEGGEGPWQVVLAGLEDRIPVSRRQQHLVRELAR